MTSSARLSRALVGLALLSSLSVAQATETENTSIRILPTPGTVAIDGNPGDWDLSGGIFACSDVENLGSSLGTWLHLMWDKDNLYVLTRSLDETPLNNPGNVVGDMGFLGDSLQLRLVVFTGAKPEIVGDDVDDRKTQRTTHITAWRDCKGKDVIDLAWGMRFKQGNLKDAKSKGGKQAFAINADGKGYVQELAIPWALLAPEGWSPADGSSIWVTTEPNFSTSSKLRVTTKDIFRAGISVDRAFTFGNPGNWGDGRLLAKGAVAPQPLRLSDKREFPVALVDKVPVVDWTGLVPQQEWAGFAPIAFEMPEDGYVSLNVRDGQGQVVRHLLNATWFAKGKHEVKWDGLTNTSHLKPGDPVAAGSYTYDSIRHAGIGLRLVGWACNAGKTPFDSPDGSWGGDMGCPISVATSGERMVLGWAASEAGQAVVCTDLDGNVQWRHKRGGFGGAALVAISDGLVFVYDAGQGNMLYRLNLDKGDYSPWQGTDDATLSIGDLLPKAPKGQLSGLDAAAGKLYLSYGGRQEQGSPDLVAVLDIATGKVLGTIPVPAPGDLEIGPDGAPYVISGGTTVLRIDVASGKTTPVVSGFSGGSGLAIDKAGAIYVACGDPDNQVLVWDKAGKPARAIGRKGGRPLTGPWDRTGMRFAAGLRVDQAGKLWVMENDPTPRRISTWKTADGAFVKEFFGPTSYGAGGGSICPADPLIMFGHGCEWRLDAKTGRAECLAVVNRHGRDTESNSRWGYGKDGRLYLAAGGAQYDNGVVAIYERLAAATWKLRTTISPIDAKADKGMIVWADANDDGQEQDGEKRTHGMSLGGWINGWYMPFTQSMIFYGQQYRLAPVGWTACGAPVYDPTQSKRMPGPPDATRRGGMSARIGCGTEDGALMVYNGHYGADHSDFQCWDIEAGRLAWAYPNNYVGVHGGHKAPPRTVGMIRAAYDLVGSVKLPAPVGNLFAIATDKGEWHLMNGDGFYISSVFQGDPLKIQWPSQCVPGAVMDNVPPGMGGEDFGGSIAATRDGQLYIQAGKTAFINLKVVGLETVRTFAKGAITVGAAEVRLAEGFRKRLLEGETVSKEAVVKRRTVPFTGDLGKDFVSEKLAWKASESSIDAVIAYDDQFLYLGWSVANDVNPWVNGATEPAVMYAKGDTVDLQLGSDAGADRARTKPAAGDLRLSIGDPRGKGPVAVIYRPVAPSGKARRFFSGTVKEGYEIQDVSEVAGAKIVAKADAAGKRYVVEAAIPLAALGIKPAPGLKLAGDLGVTYGNAAGDDTVLRSHWANQDTGLVADEVWELVPVPKNWGTLVFE